MKTQDADVKIMSGQKLIASIDPVTLDNLYCHYWNELVIMSQVLKFVAHCERAEDVQESLNNAAKAVENAMQQCLASRFWVILKPNLNSNIEKSQYRIDELYCPFVSIGEAFKRFPNAVIEK